MNTESTQTRGISAEIFLSGNFFAEISRRKVFNGKLSTKNFPLKFFRFVPRWFPPKFSSYHLNGGHIKSQILQCIA